ncbi:MAG: MFS transporter [Actinomycetota bacterium]|nr:MFS transporter [Actinomycetota bacterium]
MGTPQARWVLLATVLGSGMAMLDATVVNVALKRIGTELDAGFSGLQWTVNAYTLTLASLILMGGSLGDRFGRRRVFLIGTVWFAAASLLCGLAPDVGTLVAARALQGVGGALLTPGSLALISASFSGRDRAAAVGAWSGFGGVAGAVGPFVGGWLVGIDWRLVFLVNLPLAAVVVAVTLRHVPESRDPQAAHRLDWSGTALVIAGLGALTHGLTAAGEPGSGPGVWGWVAAGLVALAAFTVVQRRSPAPLVPPVLFASRQFAAANAVTLLVYAALGVVFVLLVLHLQVVAGFDPLPAGTAVLPATALMLLFSARVGALAQRIGPRPLLTAGPLVAAAGVLLMARIGPDAGWLTDVLPATAVFGAGLTLLVAPLTATVLDSAPGRLAGAASGVNNAVARAAGLLAVAVVPAVAGLGGTGVGDPAAFGAGFRTAMAVCAGLLVAGALGAAVLVRRPLGTVDPRPLQRPPVEQGPHRSVSGPQSHPTAAGEGTR